MVFQKGNVPWNKLPDKHCIDCGKTVNRRAKRCYKCANLGSLNPQWKDAKIHSKCMICGKDVHKYFSKGIAKFCSKKCLFKHQQGTLHPRWKGGRYKSTNGYTYIWNPKHPHATCGGYVVEHRLEIEKKIGRYLNPTEIIHHLDFDKSNNHVDNLHLFPSNSHHTKYHGFLQNCVMDCLRERIVQLQ